MTFKREGVAYSDDGAMLVTLASGSTIASPTFTGVALFADGSESAPSISWASETTSGFYRRGSGRWGAVTGGVEVMEWASGGPILAATGALFWNNSNLSAGGSLDTTLTRQAAGVLQLYGTSSAVGAKF